MIRHVIWDFDGTLFDTYPLMSQAFHEALARLHCPDLPTRAEVRAKMRLTVQDAIDAYVTGRGLPLAEFTAIYRPVRLALEAESGNPFPGARALCRAIVRAGGRNYMFTHRSRTALPMLDRHGMTGDFTEIVTADDGFPRKPAPDAIDYLVAKHGLDRADTIMVGDRELDIAAGRAAGVRTCRILWDDPGPTEAEFAVRELAGLYGVLGLDATNH